MESGSVTIRLMTVGTEYSLIVVEEEEEEEEDEEDEDIEDLIVLCCCGNLGPVREPSSYLLINSLQDNVARCFLLVVEKNEEEEEEVAEEEKAALEACDCVTYFQPCHKLSVCPQDFACEW
ncbi:hypothetical protein JOB18_013795 [Solea senegalensis]|uniref:Uncharacterized protein n=1 Tax=Solea senegalensis TaxID=28829 RepID=A0AAV6RMJ1_SOLSE|nr:hypothetical protein JOB18_013795 [Solea senegalensis]